MSNNANERWLSRQELADRYGLPAKTPAQWASKGTGPRYARMGRHVRYRLSDVIDWETQRLDEPGEVTRAGAWTHHAHKQIGGAVAQDANTGGDRNCR